MERVNVNIEGIQERYITLAYLPQIIFVNGNAPSTEFGLLRLSAGDCALAKLLALSTCEIVEEAQAPLHSTSTKR